jgi:TolA-binding protein
MLLVAHSLWAKPASPKQHDEHARTPQYASAAPAFPHVMTAPAAAPVEPERSNARPRTTAAPSADALLAAARASHTRERLRDAERLYRQVIARYPSSAAAGAARVALGRLLQTERTQPSAALPLFDDYLRVHSQGELVEEALYYRALALERLGRTQQAAASLRALLVDFPHSLYAAPARARLTRELGP